MSESFICEDIAAMIDHSILRPNLTEEQVRQECMTAIKYKVATVCCVPSDVATAKAYCQDSDVKVCAVVGFPHGNNRTETKILETRLALDDGAEEIDMVLHIGKLLSGSFDYVQGDIAAVVEVAHRRNSIVKVILENCYLDKVSIARGCRLAEKAGADFVKTSTGFAPGGTELEDLKIMRASVSDSVQIKAAGGIRDLKAVLTVRELGVTRIGAT
ncbi:MAG: deoxyribose-phosphate aldolase, partial [Spirochaetales bacterium]|nr:deoxyribose-phosphate aldolase [Spirochaetales bacterium]